ncbi:proteinrelated to RNA-binding protein cabeza [Zalerion maritima]|uniref:Proteinrelated to RNA-binding protein cabeza n=1 Tax=Zalerion maritima TaxID=339359 RepID=A0AAD5RST8_9PEZI|nr:proteinrelated to RNA-binding protein cabeza [Zalerion maritima]
MPSENTPATLTPAEVTQAKDDQATTSSKDVVSGNDRVPSRHPIPWTRPRMAEKLLLCVIYEVEKQAHEANQENKFKTGLGTAPGGIPWSKVAQRISPGSSGSAIKQKLEKVRLQVLEEGHFVPPVASFGIGATHDDKVRGYIEKPNGTHRELLFDEDYEHPKASYIKPGKKSLPTRKEALEASKAAEEDELETESGTLGHNCAVSSPSDGGQEKQDISEARTGKRQRPSSPQTPKKLMMKESPATPPITALASRMATRGTMTSDPRISKLTGSPSRRSPRIASRKATKATYRVFGPQSEASNVASASNSANTPKMSPADDEPVLQMRKYGTAVFASRAALEAEGEELDDKYDHFFVERSEVEAVEAPLSTRHPKEH